MKIRRSNRLRTGALASVALVAVVPGPMIAPARAQALQPVVDVCSGITLPRSAVTDIVGAINQPIVQQVESTVDGLTIVSLILAPLLNVPDLNLDLSSILADAAAGDPITLQILDTEGNILTPSDACNVGADAFTLNQEGGVAIGGNSITGLGTNGQIATAAEADAIAIGNNASTAVGATGSVAIGTGASATAANSVALGNGSVADRGALAGYTAPGLDGTYDSAGSVSVGSAGALRQITNVAPGTQATDAATVGQVQGALDAIADISTLGVQYDDATQATVTLGAAGGTTITNLADGGLSATSSDAVNGSQLFATNTNVAANAANIATNSADISTLQTNVANNTANIATNTAAIAGLQTDVSDLQADVSVLQTDVTELQTNVAANTADIADLQTGVAANTADIAALSSSAVRYDDATQSSVTFGGTAGTTLTNVAAGTLAATSSDAVNGAQLFATNTVVTANTGAIADLDARVTVNEASIFTLEAEFVDIDARVTVNEGQIAFLDSEVINLGDRVTINEVNIATLETDVTNIDARVTTTEGNVAILQQQVANVPVRFVSDVDGVTPSTVPTDTAALASASGGATRLTNVAAGTLAAGSTDAVNGSQLFATNQQVAQNTADITTISNNLAGSTVVAVQYSNPGTPTQSNGGTVTNDVTLVGANASAPVALHNVANGMLANDAVNLGQLQSGMASSLADSMAYTDTRFDELAFDLESMGTDMQRFRRDAFSGTASAMAVAGIPQTMEVGKSMVGGAIGHYRGQTAFAIGASTTLDDGRAVVKAGATLDTHGKGGFSAGAGFSF